MFKYSFKSLSLVTLIIDRRPSRPFCRSTPLTDILLNHHPFGVYIQTQKKIKEANRFVVKENMIKLAPLSIVFLLVTSFSFSHPLITQARPLSITNQQRYGRLLDTLGMMCKCCDLPKNECTSRWSGSCSNIQCIPWKLY